MAKLITIVGLIAAVVFTYIIMLASQGATNELVATANASGNWTAAPDFALAQGIINSFPLWQWLVPGLVGVVLIAIVFKSQ